MTTQIVLTHQPGLGWNFAVFRSGKALPAEDPQDLRDVGQALKAALQQLQATVLAERDEREQTAELRGSS